ncbi:unnamed protein product [Dibothriocephalus latus]|uniref:WH1 domain-containing protein n=1 Tax=Dibothriocephalus latus TaxID=60516 RepID=A0A3P6TYG2_DIBLA|nr:unnamed protein product [Dibothriocephalus latus]
MTSDLSIVAVLFPILISERPVATAKAHVMVYDSKGSSWIYSGGTQSVAKVQLYFNSETNAYRVVGWSLQDREVVINCLIPRGLKYHKARPNFHQWRDNKQQVYGLNFAVVEEAEAFAAAIEAALESLAQLHRQQQQQHQHQQQYQQPQQQQPNVQPQQQPPPQMNTVHSAPVLQQQQQQQQQPAHINSDRGQHDPRAQAPQQQQRPVAQQSLTGYNQTAQPVYSTQTSLPQYEPPSYSEPTQSKKDDVDSIGYVGLPIQRPPVSQSNGQSPIQQSTEYALPNVVENTRLTASITSSNAGYRAPSLLSESGRSVNGSIHDSVDGRYVVISNLSMFFFISENCHFLLVVEFV